MSKSDLGWCPCGELGKDGTHNHFGEFTTVVDNSTKPDPRLTLKACENHLQNYLRHKLWKIKE